MNYLKVYKIIIQKAKSKNRMRLKKTNENYVYYENHHIIPKCIEKNESEENKVLLTAKEHYVCHKLLTYIYPGNRKIALAFHHISFNKKYETFVSSRDYSYIEISDAMYGRWHREKCKFKS